MKPVKDSFINHSNWHFLTPKDAIGESISKGVDYKIIGEVGFSPHRITLFICQGIKEREMKHVIF